MLTIPFLLYGIDPNINALRKIEGFESSFFSPETGFPYLRIKYADINTVKPKLGFLKFGIAFLKIKDLRLSLDLRESSSQSLFSKWNKIASQKAIKYATMEPISISLTQLSGSIISLKATKGKFSPDGGLKLWGEVECKINRNVEEIKELSVYFDSELDSLIMFKGKDRVAPLIVPFKKNELIKTD